MIDQTQTLSLMQLGWAHFERGHTQQAQTIFRGLAALDPKLPYPWYMMAMLAQHSDPAHALSCIEHALGLLQKSPQPLMIPALLLAATLANGLRDTQKARAYLGHVVGSSLASAGQKSQASVMMRNL